VFVQNGEVPESCVGRLIGAKGKNVNRLSATPGIFRIGFGTSRGASPNMQKVTVVASSQRAADNMIAQIQQDAKAMLQDGKRRLKRTYVQRAMLTMLACFGNEKLHRHVVCVTQCSDAQHPSSLMLLNLH